jgi:hypothetical protein
MVVILSNTQGDGIKPVTLHGVITTGRTWDAQIATHGTRPGGFQAAA